MVRRHVLLASLTLGLFALGACEQGSMQPGDSAPPPGDTGVVCDSSPCADSGAPPPDTGFPSDGGHGVKTCPELIDCWGACTDANLACILGCSAMAGTEVRAAAEALRDCAEAGSCADDACVLAHCSDELRACERATASVAAPRQIEGIVTDATPSFGLESAGWVRFIRDDGAGAEAGIHDPDTAFYRLTRADYTATQDFEAGCRLIAHEIVSFTDPPAVANNITLNTATGEYSIITSLTATIPLGAALVCLPPTGSTHVDFLAGLNISNGTVLPVTDGETFSGSAMAPAGLDRAWTWDLIGVF